MLCDIGQVMVPLRLWFPQLKMGTLIGKTEVHRHVIGQDTLSFGNHFLLCKMRMLPLRMNLGSPGCKWVLFLAAFPVFLPCSNKNFNLQILCKYWIYSNGFVECSNFLGWWLMWFSQSALCLLQRLFLLVLWTAQKLNVISAFLSIVMCHLLSRQQMHSVLSHRAEEASAERPVGRWN